MCFTVGQALAFVVTVSQEGFLTLSTHKMLQTHKQTHSQAHMVSTAVSQYIITFRLCYRQQQQSGLDFIIRSDHSQISTVQMSCYCVQAGYRE